MQPLIPIALFGFVPLVIALFAMFPARRAVIIAVLAGWMFLPLAKYGYKGLPDYDKPLAIPLATLLAALIFDAGTLLSFRPRWIDLPAAVWCLAPFASSMANGLGPWDGMSSILENVLNYGLPYFLGRCYFKTLSDLRELAIGFIWAGMVYVPLCWVEFRLSAQLHGYVYGTSIAGMTRYAETGFPLYRPSLFMGNGLIVAMFMSSATLCAFYMWSTKAVKRMGVFRIELFLGALYVTTVLCQVMGAVVLLHAGIAVMWLTKFTRMRLFFATLVLLPILYIGTRANAMWTGDTVVTFLVDHVSERRARSLETRLQNESQLIEKALLQKWTGWGRWGQSRLVSEKGRDFSLTDGLWTIYFGRYGLIALAGFVGMILMPSILFCWRLPGRYWGLPSVAPMIALCTVVTLYMFDSLLNATINPVITMIIGAVASATAIFKVVPQPARRGAYVQPMHPVVKGVPYGH